MVHKVFVAAAAAAMAGVLPAVNGFAWEGLPMLASNSEKRANAPYFDELKKRFGEAPARVLDARKVQKRQTTHAGSSSHAASSGAGGQQSSGSAGTTPSGTIPIDATTTPGPTSPLPTTYTAGATAPIQSAPALPNIVINPANWPMLDQIPPLNSTQVQGWINAIDWSKVPNIQPTGLDGCSNTTYNAEAIANAAQNGWWTCGGHTRSSDIVACPDKDTWGMSFDDGPSPDTPRLLQYLVQHNLKSTFFVVGSRVISRPDMLQYEYMAGNQISVHTWSHPALTTLTNEQIVAELGWTKQAIQAVLGVTPNTMRPPYGDLDDRVRAISLQMGLTPILWTTDASGQNYDTNDWWIAGGRATADQVVARFEGIIQSASQLSTGFIVLAHDLYQQSTSLAIEYVLPYALAQKQLTIQPIYQCLGQNLADVYIETAPNNTNSSPATTTLDRGSSAQTTAKAPQAANNSGNSGAASHIAVPAVTMLLAVAGLAMLF